MRQAGFTLIEFLVAMAVGGLVMGATVPAIFQTLQGTGRNNGMVVALNDIDRAAHWLTRDVGQALTTDLIDGAPPVSQMTLSWSDLTVWAAQEGTVAHSITYTHTGTELVRNYDGQVSVVGKHLTSVVFSISGRLLTVTLTSSPASFFPRVTESRTYTIYLRPEQ